jgi:hypothetical protein
MKSTLHPPTGPPLAQHQVIARSARGKRPKAFLRSRLTEVRRWAGELSSGVAANRYVFYGSLILVASLIAGAVTRVHDETLWRSASALGIATVVIGLVHVWLDARSDRSNSTAHHGRRVRTL